MLIRIDKSELFTKDPAERFARRFNVPNTLWTELWMRYSIKDYTVKDLQEYMYIKTQIKPRKRVFQRWIKRTEVFMKTRDALKKGATTVVSSFFGKDEEYVVNELLKNVKSSGMKSSRSWV